MKTLDEITDENLYGKNNMKYYCEGKKGSKELTVHYKHCVRCGKELYGTNGYESEIVYFCTNKKCYLFGAYQITMENYKNLV